jgi:hypothetical protein
VVVVLAAWKLLEWFFAIALVGLTGAVGLVFIYIVAQLFLNPGRKPKRP